MIIPHWLGCSKKMSLEKKTLLRNICILLRSTAKKLREIEFQFYKDTGELQKRTAVTQIPESKFPSYFITLCSKELTRRQRELLTEVCLDLTPFTGVKVFSINSQSFKLKV